jgi:hypothetical protein
MGAGVWAAPPVTGAISSGIRFPPAAALIAAGFLFTVRSVFAGEDAGAVAADSGAAGGVVATEPDAAGGVVAAVCDCGVAAAGACCPR